MIRKWLVLSQPENIVRYSTRAALQLGRDQGRRPFSLDWLTDRRFVNTHDHVLRDLKNTEYRFKAVRPVVFLCGAAQSKARDRLRNYLQQHGRYNVFYAETAWDTIVAHDTTANALSVEAKLGALASSFITSGPVKWVDRDSALTPVYGSISPRYSTL